MVDGEGAVEGQEPEGAEGQEPAGQSGRSASSSSETTGGQEPAGDSGSRAADDPLVKELRAENARRRKDQRALEERLAAFEKAEQERKNAELTAEEKLAQRQQEIDSREAALERRARETNLRAQVVALAGELSIVDPDAATVLLERDYELEWSADLSPTNAKEKLEELLEAKPYLKAPAQSSSSGSSKAEGNPAGRQSVNGRSGETDEQRRSRLYGGGAGIWANPEQEGGGVVLSGDFGDAA